MSNSTKVTPKASGLHPWLSCDTCGDDLALHEWLLVTPEGTITDCDRA